MGKNDKRMNMFTSTSMTAKVETKSSPTLQGPCYISIGTYTVVRMHPSQSPRPMLTDIYAYCSGKAMQVTLKNEYYMI